MRMIAAVTLLGLTACLTTSRDAPDRRTLAVARFEATDTLLAPLAIEARDVVLRAFTRQKALTVIPIEPAARPRNRSGQPVNAYYIVTGRVRAPHADSVVATWRAINVETGKITVSDSVRVTRLDWKAGLERLRRSAESARILTKPSP